MSRNVVGVKLHSSGWCGSNSSSSGGRIVVKALATPAPAGQATRPLDCGVGDRMIRVERVAVSMCDDDVGRGLDDQSHVSRSTAAPLDHAAGSRRDRAAERRTEQARGSGRLRMAICLTRSTVWSGSFHSSPDSPRSPYESATTRALPPSAVVTAMAPAARQTKSAEWAPITSSLRLRCAVQLLITPPFRLPAARCL